MDDRFPFTRIVRRLPASVPFVGPEALERRRGEAFRVRAGANESAFGISPLAREAMFRAVERSSWYNDPENHEIRAAIARHHGVPFENVSVGSGIDDLLGLVVRVFVEPGEPVVTSLGAYPTFNYHVNGFGGLLHFVPYRNDRNDLEGLADAAVETEARLVYLSNPDNPTGTWHPAARIRAFEEALPDRCLLILDEAYSEFATQDAPPAMAPIRPRVIRMRTFSKAHGMAGARIGYAVADAVIAGALEKVRHHYGVNRVAQAGALASLEDTDFVANVVGSVVEGRADYARLGESLGLPTLPSATNFVAFDAGTVDRANTILETLQRHGAFVRKPAAAPLDRYFRVTVGTPEERLLFAGILRTVLAELSHEGSG
ncbi:MAG: aminotransferase class I/II-fold pyridoxal phosphate-dependent enzyme [Gemmatimonadota bacterium]|nr:aminotransferase class I/II-fold pyridoxal phosphate-dependent enzyme [Gemmatimonadota bacterium]